HQLLPWLAREMNTDVADAVLRLGVQAAEAHALVCSEAERMLDAATVSQTGNVVDLDINTFQGTPDCIVREALASLWRRRGWPLADMSFDRWRSLVDAASVASGACRVIMPG